MRRTLTVVRGGMLTTVQDLGRWGHQASGVPVAGPMDAYSHRLANRLVGNPDGAAALEITLVGPELEADGDVVCAVCGAMFELSAGGRAARANQVFELRRGERLKFGPRIAGARATLAVRGGFDVPAVLGSRATSLISAMGPFGGRPVPVGAVLQVGPAGGARLPPEARGQPLRLPDGGTRLHALPGPHDRLFARGALEELFSARYALSTKCNRMGYRLDGPPLPHGADAEILSDATPMGSVQVPKSGQPILLMADRQTTGGYPKIATVIAADLPLAGQLAPGDWVTFAHCTRQEAVDALRRLERRLSGGAA
jgi:antagonist of KipI